MNAVTVVEPGLCLTVQDAGREGYQHIGVAPSGALDMTALRVANLLAGNAPGAAALEALYAGPVLRVEAEHVIMASAGAQCSILIERADGERDASCAVGESFELRCGDIVRFGPLRNGASLYIAVEGGLDVPVVMGSRATYLRGRFGGVEGRKLQRDDRLAVGKAAGGAAGLRYRGDDLRPRMRLRVLPGAQYAMFTPEQQRSFFEQTYVIDRGDRMALRLAGESLPGATSCSIVSDAVQDGAIQIAGDGLPIVMLRERQTTGGYPKIATIISADLPALGRLAPGMEISFERLTFQEAIEARRAFSTMTRTLGEYVAPAQSPAASFDPDELAELNLISGVWSDADWIWDGHAASI